MGLYFLCIVSNRIGASDYYNGYLIPKEAFQTSLINLPGPVVGSVSVRSLTLWVIMCNQPVCPVTYSVLSVWSHCLLCLISHGLVTYSESPAPPEFLLFSQIREKC